MPNDIVIEELPEEVVALTSELKVKSIKEQRDNLELFFCQERTYLVLAAIHRDESRNILNKISCKKGIPIGGYVYDATADCYAVSCVDYVQLGYIPISIVMRVGGQGSYQVRIPIAEPVVKRFLSDVQKKDVKNFRAVYKADSHRLEYIQMIDCNG